jgi:hypothetical protein
MPLFFPSTRVVDLCTDETVFDAKSPQTSEGIHANAAPYTFVVANQKTIQDDTTKVLHVFGFRKN